MTEEKYPTVFDRIKAAATDVAVIIVLEIIVTFIFFAFVIKTDHAPILILVFIFFLYDPLFTSIFGGTMGHLMVGIRVKRESNETKNILFPLAILRFIVKVSLGWISLFTVSGNAKRKAIHDYLVGSVVVYGKRL